MRRNSAQTDHENEEESLSADDVGQQTILEVSLLQLHPACVAHVTEDTTETASAWTFSEYNHSSYR